MTAADRPHGLSELQAVAQATPGNTLMMLPASMVLAMCRWIEHLEERK